uniref:N-glycosylase/DNA lyase n=1 Tax=Culicoides sonorensis TaxID=179676 RepID=A0A336LMN8_CULSO
MAWRRLNIKQNDLSLSLTLLGGQSFRWTKIENESKEEQFLGVFANVLWRLKQSEEFLFYRVEGETHCDESFLKLKLKIENFPKPSSTTSTLYEESYYDKLLEVYFRLDTDVKGLYKQWQAAHSHFKEITNEKFLGVRVLNQSPIENILSFICSQNNNIKRISTMVSKICELYGKKIKEADGIEYFTFPEISDFENDSQIEIKLRKASFGYRAKYIANSIREIKNKGGNKWCAELESMSYTQAHEELLCLSGIGPKVADCICLMSLNHLNAIPVDTHVFKIAKTYYLTNLKATKTVTKQTYNEIAEHFRKVYGPYAGWAQTVLFCADLKQFDLKKKNINMQKEISRKKMKIE